MNELTTCRHLAVHFTADERVFCAVIGEEGDISKMKFIADEYLGERVREWLKSVGQPISASTTLHFVPLFFTEQTRVPHLSDETLELTDDQLSVWLLDAEKTELSDEDGYAIFDAPLVNSAYDYTRLNNGEIALTELPKNVLEASRKRIFEMSLFDSREIRELSSLGDDYAPRMSYQVETNLRAVVRYALYKEFQGDITDKDNGAITVFFSVDRSGGGFAFWDARRGFFFEVGEVFHFQNEPHIDNDEVEEPGSSSSADDFLVERVEKLIHENLDRYIYAEDNPLNVSHIRFSLSQSVEPVVKKTLEEYGEYRNIEISPISVEDSQAEIVVSGLILATLPEASEILPSINLALGIENRAEEIEAEIRNEEARRIVLLRRRAQFLFCVPMVVILAVLLGIFFNVWRNQRSLNARQIAAQTEKTRLAPVIKDRCIYEVSLDWYQDVIKQIISLRGKQTLVSGFATRLDSYYPQDSGFFLSDLLIKPGGEFQITGLANDERDVSDFVRTLEDSVTDDKRHIFEEIKLDFKQGSQVEGQSLAPGISSFSLSGNYAPMKAMSAQVANSSPAAAPLSYVKCEPGGSSPPPVANGAENAPNAPAAKPPVGQK